MTVGIEEQSDYREVVDLVSDDDDDEEEEEEEEEEDHTAGVS